MKEAVFEIETVPARLDPDSGFLIPPACATAGELDEDDSMGVTRALSVQQRAERAMPSKLNPEAGGIVKTETVVWQEPSPWSARSALRRVQAWLARGNNRRSVVLLLMVLSLAAVLLLTLKAKRPRGPSVSLMQSAAAEDRPLTLPEVEKPSPETTPTVSFLSDEETAAEPSSNNAETAVRLKNAVDALTEGRLDDALAAYHALLEAHPDDPSFALTVQILGGENGDTR